MKQQKEIQITMPNIRIIVGQQLSEAGRKHYKVGSKASSREEEKTQIIIIVLIKQKIQ